MTRPDKSNGCGNERPEPGECFIFDADLDAVERDCLELARMILLFMSDPSSPLRRLDVEDAACAFGPERSVEVMTAMTDLFSAIHLIRKSPFFFSNPHCANCRLILTEHERRIMQALASVRRKRRSAAAVNVMLVCAGNPDVPVHYHLRRLHQVLPVVSPEPEGLRH